jgi:hypothetical protein
MKKALWICLLVGAAGYAYYKWRKYWYDDCYWGE